MIWGFAGSLLSLVLTKKLAIASLRVELVDENEAGFAGNVMQMVHKLSQESGLKKMPEVGIYPSMEVNAFATGVSKNDSLVVVSRGLLSAMNRDELEGVLAHEVAHIANGDMVTMTLIQGVANAFIVFFATILARLATRAFRALEDRDGSNPRFYQGSIIFFEVVFGLIGTIIVMWFSRLREFRADFSAANMTGRNKIIGALSRMRSHVDGIRMEDESIATLKIAGVSSIGLAGLLRTHPSLEERIEALQKAT